MTAASAVRVVVSGAPGTGKTTVARLIGASLALPVLSLDSIKETLADSLGLGDERWSDRLGDAAAEVIFRLAPSFPGVVAEGWWRGERRVRAVAEFSGWVEVFCRCEPALVEQRMRERAAAARHPIHRDVINPALLDRAAEAAAQVRPLVLGALVLEVDTTTTVDVEPVVAAVRAATR